MTLRWDSNSPTPDGYQLFARRSDQDYDYSRPDWQGSSTTCTLSNLEDQTDYYFVVRAYDGSLKSADSKEVQYIPPASTSTGTNTSDTTPPSWNGATTGIGLAKNNGTGGSVNVEFDTARDAVNGTNLKYNVYYAPSGSWNNASWGSNKVVANAAVHTGSTFAHAATISGLNNNVSYTFGVRVEDQSGNEDANTGTLKATPTLVQTQSTYNLMLSYAANRSGAVFLNDAAVEGNVYVFVAPTTNIKQVKFYIDGTLHQTENIAPYDLAGSADSGSGANPFNTKNLSDGYHTFSAQVIKTNGSSETISADVYVNTASGQSTSSGTTVISAYAQWVSTSSNRSNPKVLNGSTLANRVYVFVKTISDIKRVEFYIDGTLRQTENVAPYDLASTADSGLAVSFDTHALSNGNHQFNARITKTDGSSETVKAAVSVRN